MAKGSRLVFILVPLGLTVATLVCLALVWGAGLRTSALQSFYFIKADTSKLNADPTSNQAVTDLFLKFLDSARTSNLLADYYQVDLSSYCTGKEGKSIDFCSKPVANFWFNPVDVWGLQSSGLEDLFPKQLQDGLHTYQSVAHWMYVAYVIAFWSTVAEAVIGLFATCSRLISLITSLVAGVASIFVFAASLTATILYSVLLGTFNDVLKPYNIHANLGKPMFATTWLAVVFSLAAGFFWLFSICCCSPHSYNRKDKSASKSSSGGRWAGLRGRGRMGTGLMAERTPYTYERVESPFMGERQPMAAGHEMTDMTAGSHTGYEPYRHA
ncbi:hypothetical protein EV356DRAFT_580693 [Viridothelium virens]|uniref:Integral membrane protein n=1 Tax=Viridothelium virens TaxID=1048519 RepID=A0A6A6GUU8_VIRVR|nr:hypothetical protein EV356DRAFT_580693 [Viridothelium virens]